MNTSTDETVISGATESISTLRFEPAILQQSYLPSIGVDTGMKTFNYSSTISSSLSSNSSEEETKMSFIEKHKKLLVWSGFIIAAVVVVRLI